MRIEFQRLSVKKWQITDVLRLFILLVLVVGIGAFFWFEINEYLSLQTLKKNKEMLIHWRDEYYFMSVVLFVGAYGVLSAFSVPVGAWMSVAGGFMFGTFVGGTLSLFGATFGALVVFFMARNFMAHFVRKKYGKTIKKMGSGFKENQLSYMLVLRLVPLFPFWLINIVPAVLDVSPRSYFIGTLLGMIPGAFVYASVGNGLSSIVETQIELDIGIIYTPQVLAPIIGLAILILLPIVYKNIAKRISD